MRNFLVIFKQCDIYIETLKHASSCLKKFLPSVDFCQGHTDFFFPIAIFFQTSNIRSDRKEDRQKNWAFDLFSYFERSGHIFDH